MGLHRRAPRAAASQEDGGLRARPGGLLLNDRGQGLPRGAARLQESRAKDMCQHTAHAWGRQMAIARLAALQGLPAGRGPSTGKAEQDSATPTPEAAHEGLEGRGVPGQKGRAVVGAAR
jgi:hypothetical protein